MHVQHLFIDENLNRFKEKMSEISLMISKAKIPPKYDTTLVERVKYLVRCSYTAAACRSEKSRRRRNFQSGRRVSPRRRVSPGQRIPATGRRVSPRRRVSPSRGALYS